MPAESALTPLGQEFRSWLPAVLRDSPEHLAVAHATARELERLGVTIETVRAQFFPQTADLLLKVWEWMVGTTMEPAGVTIEERRNLVIAQLRRMVADPSGLTWQDRVTQLIGPGWSYQEHDPADPSSPAPYTVTVTVPFPPGSVSYVRTERLLEAITPAHLDVHLAFSGGFLLDVGQLDVDRLG